MTLIPNDSAILALQIIERGKLCYFELNRVRAHNKELNRIISNRDSSVESKKRELARLYGSIKLHKSNAALSALEISGLNQRIATLKKDLKKQKRKTFIARAGMVAIAGVSAYLLLKP